MRMFSAKEAPHKESKEKQRGEGGGGGLTVNNVTRKRLLFNLRGYFRDAEREYFLRRVVQECVEEGGEAGT